MEDVISALCCFDTKCSSKDNYDIIRARIGVEECPTGRICNDNDVYTPRC